MTAQPNPMPERATVFIVDDDASVRRALQRLIRAAGYHVEAFDNAAAYLGKATPPPARCCLVLDIRMPGMSGLDLQRALNGTARAVPIIFITGHGDDDARSQALGAGAVDVLYKPLDEHVLLEAIERALGRGERAH
jgi:FixJ family two-component response regulator